MHVSGVRLPTSWDCHHQQWYQIFINSVIYMSPGVWSPASWACNHPQRSKHHHRGAGMHRSYHPRWWCPHWCGWVAMSNVGDKVMWVHDMGGLVMCALTWGGCVVGQAMRRDGWLSGMAIDVGAWVMQLFEWCPHQCGWVLLGGHHVDDGMWVVERPGGLLWVLRYCADWVMSAVMWVSHVGGLLLWASHLGGQCGYAW